MLAASFDTPKEEAKLASIFLLANGSSLTSSFAISGHLAMIARIKFSINILLYKGCFIVSSTQGCLLLFLLRFFVVQQGLQPAKCQACHPTQFHASQLLLALQQHKGT
mmetsp:Transcript_28565/g.78456  ORF Transcript_28565/g.78456 Transcript_28565/m.78456 type:complete len:108 (-) Transcript_28565:34-357(-)